MEETLLFHSQAQKIRSRDVEERSHLDISNVFPAEAAHEAELGSFISLLIATRDVHAGKIRSLDNGALKKCPLSVLWKL